MPFPRASPRILLVLAAVLLPAPVVRAQAPAAAPAAPPAPAAPAAAPAPPASLAPIADPAPVAAPAPTPLAALLAEADAAFAVRDQPGKMDADLAATRKAEKIAPNDYEVLWRLARHHYWLADDPEISNDEKARIGKITWDYGDRATQANPARVEGWFFASSGVGMYSLGISIVTALFDGMESKFLDRLKKAQAIDPSFFEYGADVAWGRYWDELPWPMHSSDKSEIAYRKAMASSSKNLRARVYLAELRAKEDDPAEAKQLLQAVLAARPGAYDAPEERRAQALARAALAKIK
jgi:hypothetical protein